jgi:hypothetical protein
MRSHGAVQVIMERLLSSLMAGDIGLNDGVPVVGHVPALGCCCKHKSGHMTQCVVRKKCGGVGILVLRIRQTTDVLTNVQGLNAGQRQGYI